jgi:hypothetical protein
MAKKATPKRIKLVSDRTPQLFDKLMKRLLRISSRAVIFCINGLFGTQFPLDCSVDYPNPVSVNPKLQERRADMLITITNEGIAHSFHIEVQTDEVMNLVVRMFEYDVAYAIGEAIRDIPLESSKVSDGIWTISLPLALVLRWSTCDTSPDTLILRIKFGENDTHDYKAPVFKLLNFSVRELEEKGLLLLLPFCTLKFRQQVKEADSTMRQQLAGQMRGMVEELIAALERGEQSGFLFESDQRDILAATNQLLQELYHSYTEFTEVRKMLSGIYELRSDKERKQERKQLAAEYQKLAAERQRLAVERQKFEVERQKFEVEFAAECQKLAAEYQQFTAEIEKQLAAEREKNTAEYRQKLEEDHEKFVAERERNTAERRDIEATLWNLEQLGVSHDLIERAREMQGKRQ